MKDYDAADAEAVGEPITFKAAGQVFTVRRDVPAGPLLRLARIAATGDDLPKEQALDVFDRFITSIVIEKAEWQSALDEMTIEKVLLIATDLVEEMTGRPTTPRSPSDGSRSSSGPPSNGDSPPSPVVATSWS